MTETLNYLVRRMSPERVRDTYPLALMQIPGMSLAGWRKLIRDLSFNEATLSLLVVYNAAHCVVAVVRQSAAGLAFVLHPPALIADSRRILAAVETCLSVAA